MLTFFRLWAPLAMTLISRQENWHRDVTELKEGPGSRERCADRPKWWSISGLTTSRQGWHSPIGLAKTRPEPLEWDTER